MLKMELAVEREWDEQSKRENGFNCLATVYYWADILAQGGRNEKDNDPNTSTATEEEVEKKNQTITDNCQTRTQNRINPDEKKKKKNIWVIAETGKIQDYQQPGWKI